MGKDVPNFNYKISLSIILGSTRNKKKQIFIFVLLHNLLPIQALWFKTVTFYSFPRFARNNFFPFLKILTTVVVFRQTNNFSRREKKKFLMASAGTDFEPKPLKEFPEKTSEVSVMEFRFF